MKKLLAGLLTVMILLTSAYPGVEAVADQVIGESSAITSPEPSPAPTEEPEATPSPMPEPEPEPAPSPTAAPKPEATPEITPEPEQSPQPEPTADASPTPSPSPAARALRAADKGNIDMSASTSVDSLSGGILSGNQFNYVLKYTIQPVEGGGDYGSGNVTIVFPDNVYPAVDELGDPMVTGDDVSYSRYNANNKNLIITLNSGLGAGNAKSINIVVQTENFNIKDGTEIKLSPVLTARADGKDYVGTIDEDEKPVVKIRADDDWMITKIAGTPKAFDDHYTVDYKIVVENKKKSGSEASDYNRYGRLRMESYVLKDTLPSTGLPAGGEATSIKDVKIDGVPLSESNYTLTYDGSGKLTGFETSVISKAGSGLAYVGADTPATTLYTFTAVYPRTPYITDSNKPLKEYTLTNTAKIDYQLLGESAQTKESAAPVTLGEKEPVGVSYDLTFVKKVSVDGRELVFTGTPGKTVSFGLYFNEACTEIATDVSGEKLAGAVKDIDLKGEVTFSNLRGGTYYLKETVTADGVNTIISSIPVVVNTAGASSTNGSVTAGGDPYTLNVMNTTDNLGIVEFSKFGKDAGGNVAPLADCAFSLTSKTNPLKVYTATSDSTGKVTFNFIPAGAYTLKETGVGSDEYLDGNNQFPNASKTWDVTVEGNKVTEPSSLEEINYNGSASKGILNISPKGRFGLTKTDSLDESKKLAGAEFEIYGPYAEGITELPEGAQPVKINGSVYRMITGQNGTAVSVPLNEGKYFIQEVKAPGGYTASEKIESAVVTANSTADAGALMIKNEEQYGFSINKVGITGADSYEEQLYGVTFEVYEETSNELVASVTTKADGTGLAVTDEIQIDKGRYYYKETAVPEGWKLDETPVHFTIPLADGGNQLKVKNYTDKGRVRIIKKDAITDEVLEGIQFGIYSDAECKNKVAELTTDNKGEAVSALLATGTYYAKEVTPEGYAPMERPESFVIRTNEVYELNIANEPLRTINIIKSDSVTGEKLPGVKFGLFLDADANIPVKVGGVNLEAVTSAEGKAVFEGLLPNKDYYVKELSTPPGYQTNAETQKVTTTDKITEFSFLNSRLAKFMLNKVTVMDGSEIPMAGVKFALYSYKGEGADHDYSQDTPVTELTTDVGGNAQADNLNPGDYWLVETDSGAADGVYSKIASYKITLEAGLNKGTGYADKTEKITNITESGRLEIEKMGKTAAGAKTPISAAFGLFTDENCTVPAHYTGGTQPVILVTDSVTGRTVSGWLAPGTYYLKETHVSGDYTIGQMPVEIEVKAAETTGLTGDNAVINMEKGQLKLSKKAVFDLTGGSGEQSYDLTGAEFRLFKKVSDNAADDIAASWDTPADVIDMSAVSGALTAMLDAGDYWVVETRFPGGYFQDSLTMTPVTVKGETYYRLNNYATVVSGVKSTESEDIVIGNRTDNGRLRIEKRGFSPTGSLLDGAQFEVYIEDEKGEYVAEINKKVTKVQVSASSDGGGYILETGTAGTGNAVTVDIEPGNYYIKEISTAKIPGGTWYWYTQWTGPVTVEKGGETKTVVLNYTMEGEGTKTDNNGKVLKGATLGVFADKDRAEAMAGYIEGLNMSFLNANYEILTADEKKTVDDYGNSLGNTGFLAGKGILQTAVSGPDGKFKFEGLIPGRTYYIAELMAPKGYRIDNTVRTVTVNADGSGFDGGLTIPNIELGRLQVSKNTQISDIVYPVKGVKFEVYYAVGDSGGAYSKGDLKYRKGQLVASGLSDVNGIYTSILLNAGTYIVEEISVADAVPAVKKEDTYRIVTVEDGKTNTEYAKDGTAFKGFYNSSEVGQFLIKKITEPAGGTVPVSFRLEKKNGKDQYETVTSYGNKGIFTVTANGADYLSNYLEAGDYQIVEVSGTGLTLIKNPIKFTVESGKITGSITKDSVPSTGALKDQPLIISNDRQGTLVIEKTGVFGTAASYTDKASLSGVTFKLFKNVTGTAADDCVDANLVQAEKSTDNNGKITWNYLDAGKYWLKETGLGANSGKYTMDETIREILIEKGKTNSTLTGNNAIKNITTYGKLTIKKVDANAADKGLSAKFAIYSDESCTKAVKDINGNTAVITTSGPTGRGTSGLIPAGEYYLKEITLPDGYTYGDNGAGGNKEVYGPYTVETNQTTDASGEAIKNRLKFTIEVVKTVTGQPGTKLDGVTIALYPTENDAKNDTNRLAAKTTVNGTGKVSFDNLTVADDGKSAYWYKEIAVPAGYDLNENVFRVDLDYDADSTSPVVSKSINNDVLGRFQILKQGRWQGISDTSFKDVQLAGAQFKVYAVSGDKVKHQDGGVSEETLTTGADGKALSKQLEPGWYELVETVPPEGYALMAESVWVEVQNNRTNKALVDAPIENIPDKGRFYLEKQDGAGNKIGNERSAQFKVEKYNAATSAWESLSSNGTITAPTQGYTSHVLVPGRYRVIETVAPQHKTGGKTVDFVLDKTPVEFTVTAGVTVKINGNGVVKNDPKGTIRLTKFGEPNYLSASQVVLPGARFELYTDNNGSKGTKIDGTVKVTDSMGVCMWENMDPGYYWIQEIESSAVSAAGYGINNLPVRVEVKAGQAVDAGLVYEAEMTDKADKGKLLISKADADTREKLNGAQFAIYAWDGSSYDMSSPVDTVTISAGGQNYSKFLPASSSGTKYLVVETKAPNGYTLDDTIQKTSREITLYPIHSPAAGDNDGKNTVEFSNSRKSSLSGFLSTISKSVSDADEGPSGTVHAPESLLKGEYKATFALTGYADGTNKIGAEKFTVTDNAITTQYLDGTVYKNLEPEDYDYDITSVNILAAQNADRAQKVTVNVYYQKDLAAKESGTWVKYNSVPLDITAEKRIDLSGIPTNVAGIKVEYLNVGAGFKTSGITFDAVFSNRASVSTELDYEVRRITNKANLEWKDLCRDEYGKLTAASQNSASIKSNETEILIPAYESKLPQVSIKNEIVDKKTVYYSGDAIKYQVTATNHDVENQDEAFKSPVISIRMPALTIVDESQYNGGFLVYKLSKDGSKTQIPQAGYSLTKTTTKAPLQDNGGDDYVDSDSIDTDQYVFNFADSIKLEENESIVIAFQGIISYVPKTQNGVNYLVLPAYLSSSSLVPKSMENPLGLSFTSYNGEQQKHNNDIISGEVGKNLQYLNQANTANVADTTSIKLIKSVGYKDTKGNIVYVNQGQKVSVNAADEIYYKLTVMNNSTDKVKEARIIDVFPFKGDSYVLPSGSSFTSRGTNIPSGDGYEPMQLLSAAGQSGNVSFYSTERDWSNRNTGETANNGILGSLYFRSSTLGSTGWSSGYSQSSTALGMNIDFSGDTLDPGESYEIYITMKTPGYTADMISAYLDKVMNNSAALAVLRDGVAAGVDKIDPSDRVEPNKVMAEVQLPTGSIGDYAWYDTNNNGVQDEGEPAAEGVQVTLQKNTYRLNIDNEIQKITTVAGTAVTNQDGYYKFSGLPCQYLAGGAVEGSTYPGDYVGGEYYDYTVQFSIPEGYGAAERYSGDDTGRDSNIDGYGASEPVSLKVKRVGNTLSGEDNPTIDAGFVRPFSLGDYVWLDLNNNGIQDRDEKGVAGVPVFLYKVKGPDGEVNENEGYLARTETDENGLYKFENLIEGYYVVEFDISGLKKPGGYTYSYGFTKTTESGQVLGTDSDAKHPVDNDGRIRRTDVIALNDEAMAGGNLRDGYDPRWDAGLTVYSAIGGFCFDDADYNDVHTLNIPLPGTLVELYKVHNGNREEEPEAQTTVGADGRYYFDNLVFDGESQDYQIRFVYPEGYTGVDGNKGKDDTNDSDALYAPGSDRKEGMTEIITLKKDTVDTTWDAGARKYGAIGDYVWNDDNRNGMQDAAEAPVAGMRVVLQSRSKGGSWQYLAETVTDDKGLYLFNNLKGGEHFDIEYRVVFVTESTTKVTMCQQPGVSEGKNSDAIGTYVENIVPAVPGSPVTGGFVTRTISLGYGQTDLTWDAGIVRLLSSVGDYVWFDDDYNGIQSTEDKGVPGVPVVIEYNPSGKVDDPSAWKYYRSTVTDLSGHYLFDKLEAGYYRLRFQVPDGYTITKYDQTTDAEKDSDAMIRSEKRWFYTMSFYLPEGVEDLSWDAGIYKPKVREEVKYTYNTTGKNTGGGRTPNKRTGDTTATGFAAFALVLSAGVIIRIKNRKNKR